VNEAGLVQSSFAEAMTFSTLLSTFNRFGDQELE
jgi:hypothetical protein